MVTSEDMYTEKKEIDVSYVIVSYANKTKHITNSIKEKMYYFHRLCYNVMYVCLREFEPHYGMLKSLQTHTHLVKYAHR